MIHIMLKVGDSEPTSLGGYEDISTGTANDFLSQAAERWRSENEADTVTNENTTEGETRIYRRSVQLQGQTVAVLYLDFS